MVVFHSPEEAEAGLSSEAGQHQGWCRGQLWASGFSAGRGEEGEPSPSLFMGETSLKVSQPFASHGTSWTTRECSYPQQSTEISFVPYLIQEKRGNSLWAPNPPALRAGSPFSHYKILRFCPNWATKLKRWRRKNILHFSKQKGIIYVLAAWQRTENLLNCPSHFYTTAHGEACVFSILIFAVPNAHMPREEFSWSFGRASPMFFLSWQKRIQRFLRMHDKLCHLLSLVGSAGPQFGREREEGIAL